MYKELSKLIKKTTQLKSEQKIIIFTADTQLAYEHIKRCSLSLVTLGKCKLKSIKKTDHTKCWRACGETETVIYCW